MVAKCYNLVYNEIVLNKTQQCIKTEKSVKFVDKFKSINVSVYSDLV